MGGLVAPWHGRIVRFGSVFGEEADTARRLYPCDLFLHNKIRKWGQVHFAMMIEASARAVFPAEKLTRGDPIAKQKSKKVKK